MAWLLGLAACRSVGATAAAPAVPTPPPALADPAGVVATGPSACLTPQARQVLTLMNRERAAAGLPAFVPDGRLQRAALRHARDLADHGLEGHTGSDGSQPADRALAADYPWTSVGENVAAGLPSAASAVGAWMASPPHRANIQAGDFTHLGVAFLDAPGARWPTYWVALFGTTAGDPAPPLPPCGTAASGPLVRPVVEGDGHHPDQPEGSQQQAEPGVVQGR